MAVGLQLKASSIYTNDTIMTGCGEHMQDLFANNSQPNTNYGIATADGSDNLHGKAELPEHLTSMMNRLDRFAARQQLKLDTQHNDIRNAQIEITGLELLLQDGCTLNDEEDDHCLIQENDFVENYSFSFDSFTQRSIDDNIQSSMKSISNDSIDLTRMRQLNRKSWSKRAFSMSSGKSLSCDGGFFLSTESPSDPAPATVSTTSSTTRHQSLAIEQVESTVPFDNCFTDRVDALCKLR